MVFHLRDIKIIDCYVFDKQTHLIKESPVTTPPLTTHPIMNHPTTIQTTPTTTAFQPSSHHQTTASSTADLPSTIDPTTLVQSPAAHLETNTTRQTTLALSTQIFSPNNVV